jgi:uncharacterized membrane protein YphA (DoxX/SURF4 family)
VRGLDGNDYKRALAAHLCAAAVAGYFIYAACGKIYNPRQFAVDIGNFRIVPLAFQNLMAVFMPWWEVGAAVALVVPRTRRAGAVMVSALLLIFIVAVGYAALYKGLDISCGCTGKGSSRAGWLTILRNLGLLLGAGAAVYLPSWGRRGSHISSRVVMATD